MKSTYSRLNKVNEILSTITFFDPSDLSNFCEINVLFIEKMFLQVHSERIERKRYNIMYDADIHSDLPGFISHVTSFHILMLIIFLS